MHLFIEGSKFFRQLGNDLVFFIYDPLQFSQLLLLLSFSILSRNFILFAKIMNSRILTHCVSL